MRAPWDFFEAKDAARRCSIAQADAEKVFAEASETYAQAEAAYRIELAKEMTVLRAQGQPATLVGDLARGSEQIAGLKMTRDLCKGLLDAATHGIWRHNADRRDVQRFIDWSLQVSTGRAAD
jgi:hypothetical protein